MDLVGTEEQPTYRLIPVALGAKCPLNTCLFFWLSRNNPRSIDILHLAAQKKIQLTSSPQDKHFLFNPEGEISVHRRITYCTQRRHFLLQIGGCLGAT